jgi:hypothetical protein
MKELERMIDEVKGWRLFHRERRNFIEAAACDIREVALIQARDAILRQERES